MSETLKLRAAVHDDLPALVSIYNEAIASRVATGHLEPLTVAEREAWFAGHQQPATPLFVTELEGQVAGYVTLSAYRGGRGAFAGCREISYYVAGAFRRRGIASALLEHAVDACAELGVELLLTFALAHNDASVAFLEQHGFDCWGRLPGVAIIDGQCFDHVIHGRHLRSL